jgi:thioredoxin reductase (NADPH)
VTVLHRRGTFRASHALSSKVLAHPNIDVIWHASVTRFVGSETTGLESVEISYSSSADDEKAKKEKKPTSIPCKAAFVAIGHDPISSYLKDAGVAIGEGG